MRAGQDVCLASGQGRAHRPEQRAVPLQPRSLRGAQADLAGQLRDGVKPCPCGCSAPARLALEHPPDVLVIEPAYDGATPDDVAKVCARLSLATSARASQFQISRTCRLQSCCYGQCMHHVPL